MKKLKRYDAKHNDMSHNMVYAKVNNRNLKYGVFSQNKSYFDSRPEEERALRLVSLYLPYNMPFGLKYPFVTDYEPIEPPLIRLSSEPSIQRLRRSSTPIEEIAVKSAKKPRFTTEKKKPINYAKDYTANVIGAFSGPNKYVSSLKVMNDDIIALMQDEESVIYESINDDKHNFTGNISLSQHKSFSKVAALRNKTIASISKILSNSSVIGSATGEFNPALTSAITYNVKDAIEVPDYGGFVSQEMDTSRIMKIRDTGAAFIQFTNNELPKRVHEYEIKIKEYEENAKEVAENHKQYIEKLLTKIRSQDDKIGKLVKELTEKEKELSGMRKRLEENKKLKSGLEDELKKEMKDLKKLNGQYKKKNTRIRGNSQAK
jgi:K+/H+ antiporter YhaU regulatory subunit KhtT